MFNTYIIGSLVGLGLFLGGFGIGYMKSANRNELKQLQAQNVAYKQILETEKQSLASTTEITTQYESQILLDNEQYEKKVKEESNVKTQLKYSNNIKSNLMRIISATRKTNLCILPNSSNGINAESSNSSVSIDNNLIHQYNTCVIEHNNLIDWINTQSIIYNKN
jgi:hypothetical protein